MLLLKSFITKAQGCKGILNFKILCNTTHFLKMSLCLRDFHLMPLYIYSNIIKIVVNYYNSLTYEYLDFR